jgi:hypothetical protein
LNQTEKRTAELPPAAKAADEAFFNLISRELEAAGQAEAIPHIRDVLKLRVDMENGASTNNSLEMTLSQKLTDYSLRLNATTEEIVSWYIYFLAENCTDKIVSDQALKIAEETAKLPVDAQLKIAQFESTSGRTIFRARWGHSLHGLVIEGDFIEVLVNGNIRCAFAYCRNWRVPDLTGQSRYL